MNTDVTIYGAYWCPDCRRSKSFLSEHQIEYKWIDIEQDEQARTTVEELNQGKRIIPTITFADGSFLAEPSNAELARKLGLATRDPHDYHDVTIVGGGPAGLTSAIYNARDGFSVMVIDEGTLGGQATTTESLENYPGFPEGINGREWSQRVVEQAKRFGVEFLQAQRVVGIARTGHSHALQVTTGDGHKYCTCAVLIATGADYRRLGVEGEEDFIGAGVHFCSTCDGPFYKGKHVAVVGGGYSAAEESLALLRFVERIQMVVRSDHLKVSPFLAEKIASTPEIEVSFNSTITKLTGHNGHLKDVHLKNRSTGNASVITPDGLFVFIGQHPNTAFLKNSDILLDEFGFVLTGHHLDLQPQWQPNDRHPEILETSMPGVYAAGDVRAGSTKQVASATGEGATAALLIREHLANL